MGEGGDFPKRSERCANVSLLRMMWVLCAVGGASEAELLQLAAAVERQARHPLADSVVSAASAAGDFACSGLTVRGSNKP
jgi:hypothetical protein